jgi:hypothetical protein
MSSELPGILCNMTHLLPTDSFLVTWLHSLKKWNKRWRSEKDADAETGIADAEEKSDADGGNAEDVDSDEETDWTYSIFQFYSTTFHSLYISQYVKVASIKGIVCWFHQAMQVWPFSNVLLHHMHKVISVLSLLIYHPFFTFTCIVWNNQWIFLGIQK